MALTQVRSLALLRIRPLIEKDLPALEWEGEYLHFRRLYRQIYEDTFRGKALMWVAEWHGVGVIGQLFVQLSGIRGELANGVDRAYIFAVRIKPAFRGRGVGTRLLEIVEADLLRRGVQTVTLNVAKDNQEAQRFYRHLGYRIVADEPGRWSYIDHMGRRRYVTEPSWRMEKNLVLLNTTLSKGV